MTETTAEATSQYTIHDARVDLAAAHRLAVRDQLHEGTWNHLSLVVPGEPDKILITPEVCHWSQITASSLAVVGPDEDLEQMRVTNDHLWVGYRIHYPLHQARPDAVCVLHAHPPYATALTMVEGGVLEWAEQNSLEFYGRVAYNERYDSGVPVGLDQGEEMAAFLGDDAILLFLKNHGVVVVGPTVAVAYTNLYLLERYCHVQYLALTMGKITPIPPDRRGGGGDTFKEAHFSAMKRVLDKEEPDYAD
jgi:ribulose-5-phosphate 4-epimerase/fuculose-1-phosphate aldolase